MPTEHAAVRVVHKPWGVGDLQPWSSIDGSGDAVGELWFERADKNAPTPALLLKLLFTSEPLSIQVHPDDTFARAMGMPNGKSEAWYILSAQPGRADRRWAEAPGNAAGIARVDPGTARSPNSFNGARLPKATSSSSLPAPSTPSAPASCLPKFSSTATRHSACSTMAGSANCTKTTASPLPTPWPLRTPVPSDAALPTNRTVLVASRHFVLERIDLPEGSSWALLAEPETWILVLDGHAAIGLAAASIGQAIFVGGGRTSIEVGANGLSALIAYPASRPVDSLLQRLGEQPAKPAASGRAVRSAICRPRRGADMTPLRRIAVIGNSLPRRCGIATFTTDLQQRDIEFTPEPGDLHRGDDRSRSSL